MSEWRDKLAALDELREKQGKLLKELARSMALKDAWPEVWACGKVTTQYSQPPGDIKLERCKLTIKRSDGEERTVLLNTVGRELWPAHVLEVIEERERIARERERRRADRMRGRRAILSE
jgi:hypothetical protein